MKPRFFTIRNLFLLLVALSVFGGLAFWIHEGMPLPGQGVPTTKGKIAFVSTRGGHPDIYMMNGADGSNPIALTNDAPEDRSPAFAPNGSEITFTSGGRNGASPQVYRMDAMAGAKVLQVTNTSSTKDAPRFINKDIICFLDTGKIVTGDTKSNETDAEFPSAHLRLTLGNLFSTGGVDRMVVAPDQRHYLCVMKMEEGRALLLYAPDEEALLIIGVAKDIHVAYRPDGSFVAVYSGGAPFGKPQVMMSPDLLKKPEFNIPPLNMTPPVEINALVSYDLTGNMSGQPEQLPAAIDDFALSPDGKLVAFAFSEGESKGLIVHPLDSPGTANLVFQKEATQPAFSSDSTQIAFVSEGDIYVVGTTGGEAKNLTQGKGSNSQPVWSPAIK